MPNVMLGEDDVIDIVERLREINRALGEHPDHKIPDYLLEAVPPARHSHHFTLIIDSDKEDLDLDIDAVRAVLYEEVNDAEARISLTFDGVS
jgi:hypothetical protein